MVNVMKAAQAIGKLAALKFFPSDPNAQSGLVQIACEMANSNEQIDWLVARMLTLYNEWPGPREMRACFCSKHRPADGKECHSQVYFDGIPSEREETNRLILGPNHARGLIEGQQGQRGPMQIGVDPAIQQVAKMRDLNREVARKRRVEQPKPTNPNYRPISQAEIDAAVQQNRDKRAREEAGL